MPNRILKESICTSESVDALKPFEEIFYYRLIVNCDDYGRMDARVKILKSKLFPLKDAITHKNVEDALRGLAFAGLVVLYEVDGKPFLFLPTWENHQQIRAKKSKFPAPANTCNQMISDDSECPRNPIQSESESERESNTKPEAETAPACSDAVITLTLNDKSEYPVYQQQIDEWTELYPAVDVAQSLRDMKGWLQANPTRRKTKSGILRFVAGWLSKNQNQGGVRSGANQQCNTSANIPPGNSSGDRPQYGTVL